MSLEDRLRERTPKNDSTALVRRTKRNFQAESDRILTPAKKRLVESGALDIVEEFLELVDNSSFEVRPDEATRLDILRFPEMEYIFKEVQLIFRWGGEFFQRSLYISSAPSSDNIVVKSSAFDTVFNQQLTPDRWRNRDEFHGVIVEAATLAGLTQSQLKGGQ